MSHIILFDTQAVSYTHLRRLPGESPNTIFDYFPDDFLLIVDESHMTIPQFQAMPSWDRSRKNNLIKYWFRLPSAVDHRPLRFEELEWMLGWKKIQDIQLDQALDLEKMNISNTHVEILERDWNIKQARKKNQLEVLMQKKKRDAKTIFLSATPAPYELELSDEIIQQIIRPTGLLDPVTYIYPKSWDYEPLEKTLEELLAKKPYLREFLDWYTLENDVKEVFENDVV